MADDSVDGSGNFINSPSTWFDRVQAHDAHAWQLFVRLYGPLIYHWFRQYGVEPAAAADLGQKVFAAVLETIAEFCQDDRGDFRAWLRAITQKMISDYIDEHTRLYVADGTADNPWVNNTINLQGASTPDPKEERILYQRAIELVLADYSEQTRIVFQRLVLNREDPAVVAASVGLTVNAVCLMKSQILHRLRTEFAGLLDTNPD